MNEEAVFNYRRIDDRIATSGIFTDEQLERLPEWGYDSVINLLPDSSDYALVDEGKRVAMMGLDYCAIPVNFDAPEEADYRVFDAAMERFANKRLWIHCAANYRVSAFFSRYARVHLGWSDEQAASHIASLWNPDEYPVWQAFINA
jgi:protein tyrosine phosphatase (PTP) superfamily phosphohydrolase (DUF442 family)